MLTKNLDKNSAFETFAAHTPAQPDTQQPGYFKEGYVLQHTFQPLSEDPVSERKARTLYFDDGTEVFERIANDFCDLFARCADPSREIVAIKFGVPTSDDFSRPVHC